MNCLKLSNRPIISKVKNLPIIHRPKIKHCTVQDLISSVIYKTRNENLLELVLRNNHIMSESLPIFDDFKSLVKLDLSNNHLSHVSKAYFGKMKKLKVLRLNNNKITYITSLAFHNLVEIEQIDLSVNWLTYINTPVFT